MTPPAEEPQRPTVAATGERPAPAAPWPDIPGYQIHGELAHGNMGMVYRAWIK